jgi:hypothetical protein
LRGAETLTFREDVTGSGVSDRDHEDAGLTKQKLSELGLSEEDLAKLGFE